MKSRQGIEDVLDLLHGSTHFVGDGACEAGVHLPHATKLRLLFTELRQSATRDQQTAQGYPPRQEFDGKLGCGMDAPVGRKGHGITRHEHDNRVAPVREQDDENGPDRHVDDGVGRAAVLKQCERQQERKAVADGQVGKGEIERLEPARPPLSDRQQQADAGGHQSQFEIVIARREFPRESHQIEQWEGDDAHHTDPLQKRPVHVVM